MIGIEEELSKNIKNMVIQIQGYHDNSLLHWVINENINYNFTFDENSNTETRENIEIIKNLVKNDKHNDNSFIFCLRNAHSILKQQNK
jgi:hypothetical protein